MELLITLIVAAALGYGVVEYLQSSYYGYRLRSQLTHRPGGGYIYAFRGRGESKRFIKIGRATDPVQRLRSHQTANPHGIEVLAVCRVKNDQRAEKLIHALLVDARGNGEWFRNTQDVRCMVRAIRQQPLTRNTQHRLDAGKFLRR